MGFAVLMSGTAAEGAAAQVVISRLVPEQWAVYRQVRLAALTDAPQAFSSTLDRESSFDDELWQRRLGSAATFLAWRQGQPVGTATGIVDDGDGAAVTGAWQLVGLWVAASERGLGIADQLVEAVAGYAREQGAPALVLWVTEVNNRARAFYGRMGFAGTGARQLVRPHEPGSWEDQMALPLR
jgi:GNAT superfamily N-acetyltransferase